jgi:hypothetical protein
LLAAISENLMAAFSCSSVTSLLSAHPITDPANQGDDFVQNSIHTGDLRP